MVSMHDKKPEELLARTAAVLKEDVQMPGWAKFTKTGHGKENVPEQKEWYHIRAASILRKVYMNGPIGTAKLRKVYSTKKNRGHRREKTVIASGKIIRSILQQLEKAGYVAQKDKSVHKGRVITPKGMSLLDTGKKK